jgi:hypothetical protein
LFQHHTQLTMIRYFNNATIRGALAALPQFNDLVDIIHFKQWTHLISLPTRYFVVPRGVNPPPPAPALPPALAPALPPAVAPARAPAAARSERRGNPAPDTGILARFARTRKRLGDLAPRGSGTVLPLADNGTDELCLSWHLRGECHSTCSRRDFSQRQLTPTEVSSLNSFLTQSGVE